MQFTSYEFLILAPLFYIVYFLLNKLNNRTYAKFWTIAVSFFIVGFADIACAVILAVSVLFNFIAGRIMLKSGKRLGKAVMISAIVADIALLGYFKYTNFFLNTVNKVVGTQFDMLNIILPLGISFYVFQEIVYLKDTYEGKSDKYSFVDFTLYLTYFPKVVSGPLVKHNDIIGQFNDASTRHINWENIAKGFFLFSIGIFKKLVIADNLCDWVNLGFGMSSPNFWQAWAMVLCFTLQIYFDFSGYSDMAIGIARIMNIQLPMNFNSPYKAENIKDFWSRWHITLSNTLAETVYFPLGGNRKGEIRTYFNLLATFLVSGIWHGAAWTYIIWGALHGILEIIERLLLKCKLKIHGFAGRVYTVLSVTLLWIFFRAPSATSALKILKAMFSLPGLDITSIGKLCENDIFGRFPQALGALMIICVIAVLFYVVFKCKNSMQLTEEMKPSAKTALAVMLLITVAFMHFSRVSSFIYATF